MHFSNIRSLSQARINWEGCGRKGIPRKNGEIIKVGAPIVWMGWRTDGLSVRLPLLSFPFTVKSSRYTHTHPFNDPFSGTTRVSQYQKGKTNLDCTEARDSEWQWHQLGYMQVCISLQTDNHASTPPLSFLQAGCPSCHPTNSIKALKALKMVSSNGGS